jgi:C1A family cysteine protease
MDYQLSMFKKNQGSCGSCWTFSSAGVIEGAYARKHNQLLEFSEQQLLDCERSGYGCGGGSPASALR